MGVHLGQIKTTFIKSFGKKLIEKYPDKFNTDFEKNKKALDELGITVSKKVRNEIAGYLVHIIGRKRKGQPLKIPYYQKTNLRKRRVKRRRRRR